MNSERVDIKTPEYVSLQFQSAGLGSRAAAFLIDQILLTIVNILIFIGLIIMINDNVFNHFFVDLPSYIIAGAIIIIFAVNWGYFFVLEYFYGGRTVGKKLVGIRVIQDNGHSITWLSCLIRNLLRIIDGLPVNYLVGILMVFFHSKHKRLGDLVAGTIVVHERKKKKKKKKLTKLELEIQSRGLSNEMLEMDEWTLKRLGSKEWQLLKAYSERFLELKSDERYRLTLQVAKILLPLAGIEVSNMSNEELENMLLLLYLKLREEWEYELELG